MLMAPTSALRPESASLTLGVFAEFETNLRRERQLDLAERMFSYSVICSPDPPNSAGKSFSFGSPSRIGRTVSA
jgi:hypothetical protein